MTEDGGTTTFRQSFTPVPDPTVLTTQALNREVESVMRALDVLRDHFGVQISGNKALVDIQLLDMAEAVKLLQRDRDNSPNPAVTNQKIIGLQALHEEKFKTVEVQFHERDTRAEQATRDSKIAVDAALQAAKEAVSEQNRANTLSISKSEAATTKQIDSISLLMATMTSSFDSKIADLKDRIAAIEGKSSGSKDMWGYAIGAIGLVVALSSFFLRQSGR